MRRVWKNSLFVVILVLLVSGCSEDNSTNSVPQSIPTLSTTTVSGISQTTAESGGTITSDGGASVTARGICWSLNTPPTITDSITTDGIGDGSFTSSLVGLTANTPYYVRAYATNSVGTAYGDVRSFTTLSTTGTVTDIDGNVYQTIVIGTQVWMAENLKVTHYRNGDPIPNHLNELTWDALGTEAYCEFDNSSDSVDIYGRLYNWYAVDDSRGLAPDGWHIPSHSEYIVIQGYLSPDAGNKMKETGTVHWFSPNDNATNESGFTALGAGGRGYAGKYIGLHQYAWFWTTTEFGSGGRAYVSELNSSQSYLNMGTNLSKAGGYSVRCIKD